MTNIRFFVGLDIGSEQFVATIGTTPWRVVARATPFANSADGFQALLDWLQQHDCAPSQTILCMEATGVYGEALAYYVVVHHWPLAVEPPLKVKRAFATHGHKTDAVDSQQIAEYACRFVDELTRWQPRAEVLEQITVLLTTREQFTVQRTAHLNALTALKRKPVHTPVAELAHEQAVAQLKAHLQTIEAEIKRLIDREPPFQHLVGLWLTIPGIGIPLAAYLLVLRFTATRPLDAKWVSAYLGMCPYERQSGKSVRGTPTSRHFGPRIPRKLLHLAARSVSTHKPAFREYYQRKVDEGKPKKLALNNVANKLLKIICAVATAQTPYDANYVSAKPSLKGA